MRKTTRKRIRWLCKALNPRDYANLSRLEIHDLGFGYDPFGLEIESHMALFQSLHYLYEYWFRVESHGVENVPEQGPILVTPNHSGVLPLDATMIMVDLIKNMERPRILRGVADHFFGLLPVVNTALYRCGHIIGARGNAEELLKQGEALAIFPEGARGTGKLFWERYKLRHFNVGFMELSLLHRVPIVPTAVIGSEEQYPMIANLRSLARVFSFPYFPVTLFWPHLGPLGLLPVPVKYHIYYGEPFHFYKEFPPETVKEPDKVRVLVARVKQRVEEMIQEGLESRKGLF
jgi:1-acyl-sn-glycerol-3-phosphate acyltransferase